MRFLQTLLLALLGLFSAAQDTTWVQTLTFDSITTRRGVFEFPDGTESYRKVLMYHKLKCSSLTTADSYACGEWDYLTYNYLFEHTGLLDSNALTHPLFLVGNLNPDSLILTNIQGEDLHQRLRTKRVVDSTMTESFYVVGGMSTVDLGALDNAEGAVRTQYTYTGTELTNAGLQPGNVDQVRLNVNFPGGSLGRFVIRMKNTNVALFDGMDVQGLSTVFDHSYSFTSGVNTIVLETPFSWDGSSNILVDISFSEPQGTQGTRLFAEPTSLALSGRSSSPDHYLEMSNDHLAISAASLNLVSDEITISCRVRGNENLLPSNTTLFEARNAAGDRVLNVHLPWNNSRIYWDAGNDGTGFDRIDKAATSEEIAGKWNHWVFTKNTNTGSQKIYLNGTLWHSGTGNTRPMTGITEFVIGSNVGRNLSYHGAMDDFIVFAKELDQAAISALQNVEVGMSHPNFADLLYQYDFNEAFDDYIATDKSPAGNDAFLMGSIGRRPHSGSELYQNATALMLRPDITFVSGSYVSHTEDSLHVVSYAKDVVSQVDYNVIGNSVEPFDTTWALAGGYEYEYNPSGTAIDSVAIGGSWNYNGTLSYWGVPFPEIIRHELGRYITPYGIGLSLGAGFTWVYDVTEYAHLLKDSVDLSAGNQQELIDLRFALIEGTPPREVVNISYPWGQTQSYSYANLDNDVSLPPVTLQTNPIAQQWIMRSRLTGHGHASDNGFYPHCCEWKDNTHYLFANGTQIDDWHVWKTDQCALNPVYPQGGTWLGAREGWCPGDLVDVHETNLTPHVFAGQLEVDYSITPVPQNNQGMGAGNYVAAFEFVELKAAAHALDAEVYNVERPSDYEYYRRENPICNEPLVVLRNAGSTTLTSVVFTYGVSGGSPQTYTWNGSLEHMETERVTLPVVSPYFWFGDSEHEFTVTVSAPNLGNDEYADNDSYTTLFELPKVYNDPFIVVLKTNNRPQENSWTVKDIQGNVVAANGILTADNIHYDTLYLPDGCYTFELLDSGNDGLSYWADPAAGAGYARFKRINSSFFEIFKPEFGKSIVHSFTLGWVLGDEEVDDEFGFSAFPNPSNGDIVVNVTHLAGNAEFEIRNARGQLIIAEKSELSGDDKFQFDLSNAADGLYLLRLTNAGKTFTKKLIIER